MFDKRAVHDFATKYYELYSSSDTLEYQVEERFADQCFGFGFKMDCGDAIERVYPNMNILDDNMTFSKVARQIEDIGLLGSAIFSKYRYVTHWAYCDSLLSERNKEWFKMAFKRLQELTNEVEFVDFTEDSRGHMPCFKGILDRIQLISDGMCYGPCPEPEDEIEQHLTIRKDGRVWFSGYNFGRCKGKNVVGRRIQYKMSQDNANRIFNLFNKRFSKLYIENYVTDIGSWDLKLTNTNGEEFYYSGSMCGEIECEGIDLTKLLQDELNIEDVWGFGYYEEDEE